MQIVFSSVHYGTEPIHRNYVSIKIYEQDYVNRTKEQRRVGVQVFYGVALKSYPHYAYILQNKFNEGFEANDKYMQMRRMPLAESYLEFNAQDLEFGFNESRRDRILRTFVRNAYYYHLNEIYSTLKNEYTDWDKPVQNPLSVRDATLEVSDTTD